MVEMNLEMNKVIEDELGNEMNDGRDEPSRNEIKRNDSCPRVPMELKRVDNM